MKLAARYATREDIERYYGEPPRHTLRAVVALADDEPAGIIGIARAGHYWVLHSEFRERLRPHLRSITLLRAIKMAMHLVEDCRGSVVALVSPDEPDSRRILLRLGFTETNEDEEVFLWPN